MQRLVVIFVLAGLAWLGFTKYQSHRAAKMAELEAEFENYSPNSDGLPPNTTQNRVQEKYTCDGRTHCSQMHSCAEAKYFLQNCPGVQMDGNNDGVPCEKQWCNQ